MLHLLAPTLLLLSSLFGAHSTAPLAPPQALTPPPAPTCRGATCVATVDVFPATPELQVRASHVTDGQADSPYSCNPCLDCRASVTLRLDPAALGCSATVWEWGHVPSPEEQEEMGGIPYADLSSPAASLRRTLTGPCSGLVPVGPGSSILTVDLATPAGRSIVTVWLACFC